MDRTPDRDSDLLAPLLAPLLAEFQLVGDGIERLAALLRPSTVAPSPAG